MKRTIITSVMLALSLTVFGQGTRLHNNVGIFHSNGQITIGESDMPPLILNRNGNGMHTVFQRSGANKGYFSLSNSGTSFQLVSYNNLGLRVGGNLNADALYIKNNGNVGIGTDNPGARFEIVNENNDDSDFIIHSKSTTQGQSEWSRLSLKRGNDPNEGFLGYYGNNTSGLILGVSGSNPLRFYSNDEEKMRILSNGNVGIGVMNPNTKLVVKGIIRSEKIKVEVINGPDYVFEEDYDLRSLEETQNYIAANKHLPEVPSAKEMEADGVELGEMNMLLLKKVEELTLHLIEQNEQLKEAQRQIQSLQKEVTELKK